MLEVGLSQMISSSQFGVIFEKKKENKRDRGKKKQVAGFLTLLNVELKRKSRVCRMHPQTVLLCPAGVHGEEGGFILQTLSVYLLPHMTASFVLKVIYIWYEIKILKKNRIDQTACFIWVSLFS